jgi:hypothetical protein
LLVHQTINVAGANEEDLVGACRTDRYQKNSYSYKCSRWVLRVSETAFGIAQARLLVVYGFSHDTSASLQGPHRRAIMCSRSTSSAMAVIRSLYR